MSFCAISLALLSIFSVQASGMEQIIDPDELIEATTLPTSSMFDDWEDWDNWEASPEIVEAFPYYRSGYDADGLVVYVTEFGKWNHREWALKPKEEQDEFWKYFEQFVRRHEVDAKRNNGQGTVAIFDWDGFSLALAMGLKMFTATRRVSSSLNYGYMVNTNYAAETFINLARPFLGNMMEKYDVYGTRPQLWKSKILKSIPGTQLPPKYGGNSDWKPLPIRTSES